MNTSSVTLNKNLVLLAQILERLEQSGRTIDADQYRVLVSRITEELKATPHDAGLDAVLENFRTVSELYENLNYEHAGLCRSALESGLTAEAAACSAIAVARRAA
jgi:hypothetical protein